MIKIFNILDLFFEDNYKEIHVREYARLKKISAPTASKILENYRKEGLLNLNLDKGYKLYRANREGKTFIDLMRIYWRKKLKDVGYFKEIRETTITIAQVILFGSLSKGNARKDSDVDIAIITKSEINTYEISQKFEKKLKREVNQLVFKTFNEIPKNLRENVRRGYILFEE